MKQFTKAAFFGAALMALSSANAFAQSSPGGNSAWSADHASHSNSAPAGTRFSANDSHGYTAYFSPDAPPNPDGSQIPSGG